MTKKELLEAIDAAYAKYVRQLMGKEEVKAPYNISGEIEKLIDEYTEAR